VLKEDRMTRRRSDGARLNPGSVIKRGLGAFDSTKQILRVVAEIACEQEACRNDWRVALHVAGPLVGRTQRLLF
jgi:hypothetical protein